MTEREALLRAVCDHPDEDTPRLAFADWLEENGTSDADRARAEFIRVQCELAAEVREANPSERGPTDWRRTVALQERRQELWAKYRERWRAQLPQWPGVDWYEPTWDRGFTEGVRTRTLSVFLEHHEAIFAAAPVRHLWLGAFRGSPLIECEPLGRLTVLNLDAAGMNDRAAEALLRWRSLDGLRLLSVSGNLLSRRMQRRLSDHFGDRGVRVILGGQHRPRA